jgi:hypothetical protein
MAIMLQLVGIAYPSQGTSAHVFVAGSKKHFALVVCDRFVVFILIYAQKNTSVTSGHNFMYYLNFVYLGLHTRRLR